MHTKNNFKVLSGTSDVTVNIFFNGQSLIVPSGVTVAAALLQAGVQQFRSSPVSGAPRAPYCMMGVCFECMVEIDGEPSRQSCLTHVYEGMQVRSQDGLRDFDSPAATSASERTHHEA